MVVCGVILSPAPGLLPDSQDWYSTTHFILQDVSSCSVVAVSWWCLLAQAGQPLRQHHPLARGGGGADRHPGVDHRLHWDQVDPHGLDCNCSLLWNVLPTLVLGEKDDALPRQRCLWSCESLAADWALHHSPGPALLRLGWTQLYQHHTHIVSYHSVIIRNTQLGI